jgi:uncharacterized protein YqjF (DUF2071 family)
MPATAATLDRIAPTRRPREAAIGYHRWSNLLFLHWRLPAEDVATLLPPGLTLDTWEGDAFVGLVPFRLSRVRPWWFPPVAGISSFCETNVRTYVHRQGSHPGVWFFSLDAASSLAVRVARWKWSLPYFRAVMDFQRAGARIHYGSRRLWPGTEGAGCAIEVTIGGDWCDSGIPPRPRHSGSARPGTLDHFLIERYILYSQSDTGPLRMGRVHHPSYALRCVDVERVEETLLPAAGFAPDTLCCHAAYCEGVDVEIFPLRTAE